MLKLRGITWGHTRGYVPLVATAQRYMEIHPNVKIEWSVRSLQAFGDFPIEKLAGEYDMIVLDHPWMGHAHENNLLIPLNKFLSADFLSDQAKNTVGHSHASYNYGGNQYALAIDAACPIAFYSPRKLEHFGVQIPATLEDVVSLAKKGGVFFGGNSTCVLMMFYMLLNAKTATFTEDAIAPTDAILETLDEMQHLYSFMPALSYEKSPIGVFEVISSPETPYAYCPWDFGYSNYSRAGYSNEIILAANVVAYKEKMLRTTLGGAGIALFSTAKNIETALDYMQYTASSIVQKTLYTQSGGQPGHREAWLCEGANRITNNFFKNTLKTLDNAWLRPRYAGYLEFQETAAVKLRTWLIDGGDKAKLLNELNNLYLKGENRCKK